jgi:dihydrofolate reductase
MAKVSCLPAEYEVKASVFLAISLDGYIADKDGSVEFLNAFQSSASAATDGDMGFSDFLNSIDLLIMGRKTFDQVVSFGDDQWPYGDKQVWIWSKNPSSVHIPQIRSTNTVAVSEAPSELMSLAQQKGYRHAYVDGGTTIQQFLQKDCIDDFILTRVPILLGEGIPLFSGIRRLSLEHLSTKAYSNGLVQSHYRVNR